MKLYPLLTAPYYMHGDATPWGGTMLRDMFGKDAPEGRVGECLEVSGLPGRESLVAAGEQAGKAITVLGEVPVLVRLTDSEEPTPVQVKDAGEAWLVLSCEPGTNIVAGLASKDAPIAEALYPMAVRPGDMVYFPAGTAFASGAGMQCYAVGAATATARRLWDWERATETEPEAALSAIDTAARAVKVEGTTVLCRGGSRTYYVSEAGFELCRLNVAGTMPLESGRMLALTALGPCTVEWPDGVLELAPLTTAVIPAESEGVCVRGDTKVLMASLPDSEALRAELGYRAENVPGLVR